MASNRWRGIVGAAGLAVLTTGSSPVLTWRVPEVFAQGNGSAGKLGPRDRRFTNKGLEEFTS